jgi:uncharacterized protein
VKLFLDTSAFAKRYIVESGSDKVLKLCRSAERLAVSVICLPELASTLNRLVRERHLSASKYDLLKKTMLADLGDADICEMTTPVLSDVIRLLESNALRAMDAIHVACAMAYGADLFASADRRQLAAARKAKLRVIEVS